MILDNDEVCKILDSLPDIDADTLRRIEAKLKFDFRVYTERVALAAAGRYANRITLEIKPKEDHDNSEPANRRKRPYVY